MRDHSILIGTFLACAVIGVCGTPSAVGREKLKVLNSETLPGNVLPGFLFMQGPIEGGSVGVKVGGGKGEPIPFTPDDSCTDDLFEGANEDLRSPQLPYLTQDLWTCDRKEEELPVVVLENDDLKVTITSQFAGKVWGIYDKKRQKDLLFANKAHQPANIGALKSWAAGGAEWNWSPGIIGHSAFSETEVYIAKVQSDRGPVVRAYEFDRYNGTVWQVDMFLEDETFYAHPRITNPTDVDLRGYWWTCVAIPADPSTRIFTPAAKVAQTSRGGSAAGLRLSPWPRYDEAIENSTFKGYSMGKDGQATHPLTYTDQSFLGNHQLGDMFFRIQKDDVDAAGVTPYIAHSQPKDEGFVLVHGHPLNGTKFFTWGQGGPGRFMQDFLAGGRRGDGYYAELQVGPAPTQMQTFPVANHSVTQWTEWFKGFQSPDPEMLFDNNYNLGLKQINEWIRSSSGMPNTKVGKVDEMLSAVGTKAPEEILVVGQAWGALEEKLLGKKLAPGLVFKLPEKDTNAYREVQPWLELVETGTFSKESLSYTPISYQTTDRWLKVLEHSAQTKGLTWLHALHLGVAYAERGDLEHPKKLFQQATDLRSQSDATKLGDATALRCLAILQETPSLASSLYKEAWDVAVKRLRQTPSPTMPTFAPLSKESAFERDSLARLATALISEISAFLQQNKMYTEASTFIDSAKQLFKEGYLRYEPDTFTALRVKVLLEQNQYEESKSILSEECFPTYAGARDDLVNLWHKTVEGIYRDKKYPPSKNSPQPSLLAVDRHRARMDSPVPSNIGCQYASEYCIDYW